MQATTNTGYMVGCYLIIGSLNHMLFPINSPFALFSTVNKLWFLQKTINRLIVRFYIGVLLLFSLMQSTEKRLQRFTRDKKSKKKFIPLYIIACQLICIWNLCDKINASRMHSKLLCHWVAQLFAIVYDKTCNLFRLHFVWMQMQPWCEWHQFTSNILQRVT